MVLLRGVWSRKASCFCSMALTLLLLLAAAAGEQHSRLFSDGRVEDATCNVEVFSSQTADMLTISLCRT